jgi:hypothetical protein
MTPSRVEWHLDNWSAWVRSYRPKLGFPSHAMGLACSGACDFDDLCREADSYAAKATDACIENLNPAEAGAVHRKWLDAVYRFPRNNYPEMYARAVGSLGVALDGRGLV